MESWDKGETVATRRSDRLPANGPERSVKVAKLQPSRPARSRSRRQTASGSCELRVLGLGLDKHRDVRVGIFPAREEVLVRATAFRGVAGERGGAGELELGQ